MVISVTPDDPERRGAVRASLYLRVHAGREREFERCWREVAAEVSRLPGNLRQTLLRDPDDPQSFVICSDWVDESAFRAFERSPAQDDLTATLRQLRESARMTVHPVVVHVEAEQSHCPGIDEKAA